MRNGEEQKDFSNIKLLAKIMIVVVCISLSLEKEKVGMK